MSLHSEVNVLRRAVVAVVESASEAAHWPQRDRRAFEGLPYRLPWLTVEFFDENTVHELLGSDLGPRYAAVVVTAGAMSLQPVRDALNEHAHSLGRALLAGTGILVSAPFITDASRYDLAFLPPGSQVSIVPLPTMKRLKGRLCVPGVEPEEVDAQRDGWHVTKVSVTTSHATGWRSLAVVEGDDEPETVAWRTQVGPGRVVVTVFPFERLQSLLAFDEVVGRVTRARGYLIAGEGPVPDWYPNPKPGSFVAAVPSLEAPTAAGRITACFSHLRLTDVSPEAYPADLTRDQVLRRLENDGSVEFAALGANKEAVYVRLAGVPHYLTLLRQAEPQMLAGTSVLAGGPTFHTLAYVVASATARAVVRDDTSLPDVFRLGNTQLVCEQALRARVDNGSVDDLLLPTVNLYVAARLAQVTNAVLAEMRGWIGAHAGEADDDERAQARWVTRLLPDPHVLDLVPKPTSAESTLGRISIAQDEDRLLEEAVRSTAHESPLEATLRAFTVERALAANGGATASTSIPLHTRATKTANLEESLYRLATLLLRCEREPLRAGDRREATALEVSSADPTADDQSQVDNGVLLMLRQQAIADVANLRADGLQRDLDKITKAARRFVGGAVAVWFGALAFGANLFWPRKSASVGDVLQLVGIAFTLAVAACTVLSQADSTRAITPGWVKFLPDLVRRARRND